MKKSVVKKSKIIKNIPRVRMYMNNFFRRRKLEQDKGIFRLCIGYPIKNNRKIQYYEFYDEGQNRTEFGIYKENGQLKRQIGSADFEEQRITWDEIEYPEYFDEDNDER